MHINRKLNMFSTRIF